MAEDSGIDNSTRWRDGPPTSPGHFWVEQSGYTALAFVYDGYPDHLQPLKVFRSGDPASIAWQEATEGLGVFLRIRTMEGLRGMKDSEMKSFQIDRHAPIPKPLGAHPDPVDMSFLSLVTVPLPTREHYIRFLGHFPIGNNVPVVVNGHRSVITEINRENYTVQVDGTWIPLTECEVDVSHTMGFVWACQYLRQQSSSLDGRTINALLARWSTGKRTTADTKKVGDKLRDVFGHAPSGEILS